MWISYRIFSYELILDFLRRIEFLKVNSPIFRDRIFYRQKRIKTNTGALYCIQSIREPTGIFLEKQGIVEDGNVSYQNGCVLNPKTLNSLKLMGFSLKFIGILPLPIGTPFARERTVTCDPSMDKLGLLVVPRSE